MNSLDHYIIEIGEMVLQSDKPKEHNWKLISIVYDVSDTHTANSGFSYTDERIIPTGIGIDSEPMKVANKIREFRDAMAEQTGKKFKQLLIQMERETGRIKIDFDFDKGNKWTIVPSRLKEMREELRPKFDQLAALHAFDLIASGNDGGEYVTKVGHRGVNRSIGSQWRSKGRLNEIDEEAQRLLEASGPDTKMNIKLERCR